jgi:hypothetical protein
VIAGRGKKNKLSGCSIKNNNQPVTNSKQFLEKSGVYFPGIVFLCKKRITAPAKL